MNINNVRYYNMDELVSTLSQCSISNEALDEQIMFHLHQIQKLMKVKQANKLNLIVSGVCMSCLEIEPLIACHNCQTYCFSCGERKFYHSHHCC